MENHCCAEAALNHFCCYKKYSKDWGGKKVKSVPGERATYTTPHPSVQTGLRNCFPLLICVLRKHPCFCGCSSRQTNPLPHFRLACLHGNQQALCEGKGQQLSCLTRLEATGQAQMWAYNGFSAIVFRWLDVFFLGSLLGALKTTTHFPCRSSLAGLECHSCTRV